MTLDQLKDANQWYDLLNQSNQNLALFKANNKFGDYIICEGLLLSEETVDKIVNLVEKEHKAVIKKCKEELKLLGVRL